MTNDSSGISGNVPCLGINGLGRIGKLSLWHHVGRKYFNEIVETRLERIDNGYIIGTILT